jgi:hypothetical protein
MLFIFKKSKKYWSKIYEIVKSRAEKYLIQYQRNNYEILFIRNITRQWLMTGTSITVICNLLSIN